MPLTARLWRSSPLALVLAGCAAPPPPPVAAAPPPPPEPVVEAPPPPPKATMPTACTRATDGTCTPPAPFVDTLCGGTYTDATLTLFAKGSPWTRGYLRGDAESWYASGGGSTRAKLLFDEEVLVLRVRAPATGGVIVGNGATVYDVLRWDGICYTLDSGELTMKPPPKAKHPPLAFHHLSDAVQNALLKDDKVRAAHSKRGKECHGVTTGEVSLACERADRAFGEAIVDYVVSGGALPPPARIPGA